jgi:4-amino-4-deoxy-L-arabinose transferase-like glycosyltransferase
MARSGDWITPRLWGEPWFQKPALLYWLIGLGTLVGLPNEHAARLPAAIIGVLFLAAYYFLIRERLGEAAARFATMILATSAGWLAYSHSAVFDVPLTAFFTIAMLMAARGSYWVSGICLGLAILSKALVPIVLAAPLLWYARKRIISLWPVAAGALLVSLPWFVLCTVQNGSPFLMELIVRHHFGRFLTAELQHEQPFWYYVPVLLALLFPWTPVLALVRGPGKDEFLRLLWLWIAMGFLLFTPSLNKLPGYLLPLLPAVAALMGHALAERTRAGPVLAVVGALLGIIPALLPALPVAIATGSRAALPLVQWTVVWVPALVLLAATWFLEKRRGPQVAVAAIAAVTSLCVWRINREVLPVVDSKVSARRVWWSVGPRVDEACLDENHRSFRYGMNYYAEQVLPDCSESPRPLRLKRP